MRAMLSLVALACFCLSAEAKPPRCSIQGVKPPRCSLPATCSCDVCGCLACDCSGGVCRCPDCKAVSKPEAVEMETVTQRVMQPNGQWGPWEQVQRPKVRSTSAAFGSSFLQGNCANGNCPSGR